MAQNRAHCWSSWQPCTSSNSSPHTSCTFPSPILCLQFQILTCRIRVRTHWCLGELGEEKQKKTSGSLARKIESYVDNNASSIAMAIQLLTYQKEKVMIFKGHQILIRSKWLGLGREVMTRRSNDSRWGLQNFPSWMCLAAWSGQALSLPGLQDSHTPSGKSLVTVALFIRNLNLGRILKLTSPFNLGNGVEWMVCSSVSHRQMDSELTEAKKTWPLPARLPSQARSSCERMQEFSFVLSS